MIYDHAVLISIEHYEYEKEIVNMKPTNYRWFIAILLTIVCAINYMDRSVLSVALPVLSKEFHMTPVQMGVLSSAFLLSYAILQLPVGAIIDKVGERRIFIWAVAFWSFATLITIFCISFNQIYFCRLLLGIGEAPLLAAGVKTIAEWFPRKERGKANGLFSSGVNVGALIALPFVAWLITRYNWRVAFFIVGSLGFIWLIAWVPFYTVRSKSTRANAAEIALIENDLENAEEQPKIPWLHILKRKSTIGLLGGYFCQVWILFVFQTWLPTYLVQARNMTLMKAGIFGMLPFLAGAIGSFVGGAVSDHWVRRNPRGRKYCMALGLFMGTSVIAAAYVPSTAAAVALIALSSFGIMFSNGAMMAAMSEIAPVGQVASLTSLVNFGGFTGGFIAPMVTGYIVQTTHSFVLALVLTGALGIVGAIIYLSLVPTSRASRIAEA